MLSSFKHPCNYSWKVHTERGKEGQGKAEVSYVTYKILGYWVQKQIICHQREAESTF